VGKTSQVFFFVIETVKLSPFGVVAQRFRTVLSPVSLTHVFMTARLADDRTNSGRPEVVP